MNIDLANKSIKSEADKYSKIKNIFTKLRDAESLNSKQRIEYFENLFEIKEYENKDLKKIFDSFREGMKNLESKRDKHLKIISELILPVADMYPTIIKKQKSNLDDLALKRKNTPQINQSKSIIEKREKENVKSYKDFQTNSINDSKYILMNYIHSELKYHATLMEELNSLFFKINDIDPLVHLKKFGESYGINDYDLIKLKNVNKEKIEEHEKNRKENEDKEKSGVYSSGEGSDEEITTSVKKSKVKDSLIKSRKNKKNNKSKNTKINSEDNEEIKESATSDKKIDED
jgi:hypothetical protein